MRMLGRSTDTISVVSCSVVAIALMGLACESDDSASGNAIGVGHSSVRAQAASDDVQDGERERRPNGTAAKSLLQLIANPDVFHGASVSVSGYFVLESDWGLDGLLYLDESHAEWGLESRVGVRLGLCGGPGEPDDEERAGGIEQYEKTYVLVEGTFRATPRSVQPGVICAVRRIVEKWRSSHFGKSDAQPVGERATP